MQIVRPKIAVIGATLALTLGAGAFGLWRNSQAQPATSAAAQIQAAASQRPVDKTDQVIWDYQQRVRQSPDDVQSYAVLGAAYMQKVRDTGDPSFYAKAQAVLDEALKRDPQNVEALIGAGTLANARHEFGEALQLGEQAKAINPTVPRIYGVIADAQTELGRYDDAVQTLQTMIDMRPDLSSYSRISYARELHGDIEGAIDAMQEAVTAGGPATENSAWVRVQLANLYFTQGDLAQAEQEYQRTLTLLPDYVYAQAGLGRVRAAQGRLDAAIEPVSKRDRTHAAAGICDRAGRNPAGSWTGGRGRQTVRAGARHAAAVQSQWRGYRSRAGAVRRRSWK